FTFNFLNFKEVEKTRQQLRKLKNLPPITCNFPAFKAAREAWQSWRISTELNYSNPCLGNCSIAGRKQKKNEEIYIRGDWMSGDQSKKASARFWSEANQVIMWDIRHPFSFTTEEDLRVDKQRLLTLRHGLVSGPYFFEGALNGNMYADFLEIILNQPKRYESLTVLKEAYVYVADNLSICKDQWQFTIIF
ncbi:hypothetical protein C0J52_28006, partial [Blattella germanica]